jgi:hypothetical protein
MRWAGNVARMDEEREVYRVLVGKPEGTMLVLSTVEHNYLVVDVCYLLLM